MFPQLSRRVHRLSQLYRMYGPVGGAFSAARSLGRTVLPEPYATRFRYRSELLQEALLDTADANLPLHRRIAVAMAGFDERLYYAYGFDRGVDPGPYLSEYSRKCARSVNDRPELLRNKEAFHRYLSEQGYGDWLPTLYGIIEAGTYRGTADGLAPLVRQEGRIVIKEVLGGGGNRVYIADRTPDGLVIRAHDGTAVDPDAFRRGIDRAIVTAFCEQAGYLDRIYAETPNTLRILTMNPADGPAFIPAAVHRFGTEATGVLDNFSQGGLSAHISRETGQLSAAARIGSDNRVRWTSCHPNTGTTIEGCAIPEWDSIARRIRRMAADLSAVRYAGWDLLVTSPGEFVLLEGNHFPDPDVIQVHRPLLTDARVRRFFEAHNVPL